jgi:hypothetical protein
MSELILLLVGLIIVIVVLSLLWKALAKALAASPISESLHPWIEIVALVVLALIIWMLFGGYVRLP